MVELVEDILRRVELLTAHCASAWTREAQKGSPLSDEEALEFAISETRAARCEQLENRA